MPRQPCCCGENKCCLYPGWHVNDGYYYADDPPENADPRKALDRNRFALNEVIIDGVHDLTFVITHSGYRCIDGEWLNDQSGRYIINPTAAHSFKVVGDPIDVDINVTIRNLLAYASGSYVNVLIVKCNGDIAFNKNYIVPSYLFGGYAYADL